MYIKLNYKHQQHFTYAGRNAKHLQFFTKRERPRTSSFGTVGFFRVKYIFFVNALSWNYRAKTSRNTPVSLFNGSEEACRSPPNQAMVMSSLFCFLDDACTKHARNWTYILFHFLHFCFSKLTQTAKDSRSWLLKATNKSCNQFIINTIGVLKNLWNYTLLSRSQTHKTLFSYIKCKSGQQIPKSVAFKLKSSLESLVIKTIVTFSTET